MDTMDISKLSIQQWFNYEQHMMFSTVNSDFTAYDFQRAKEKFSSLFAACGVFNDRAASEDQKREAVQRLRDARTSLQPIKDVESVRIYLWEGENIPSITIYKKNDDFQYMDSPDFRPYMIEVPVKEDVPVKGAVILCSGGAFLFRGNLNEGGPVAEELSKIGYQCFVVNYRLNPYTMQEGALDLARAVRYVRSHAKDYGIDEKNIAVAGFSAGGILCGEMLLNFDGLIDGTYIDPSYVPDEMDKISADASAVGFVYSFYGELGVASRDVNKFKNSDLPPAYFIYGTQDPFVHEFEACAEALKQAELPVKSYVLQGLPHGFGAGVGMYDKNNEEAVKWIADFDEWLTKIFE